MSQPLALRVARRARPRKRLQRAPLSKNGNRSAVIESAVIDYVARRAIAARNKRDRDLLDRHAEALNRETAEVLDFQAEP